MPSSRMTISRFARTIFIVIGVVLVWRGIWDLLDAFDRYFFSSSHEWTALGGIVLGIIILYVFDGNLKKIEEI